MRLDISDLRKRNDLKLKREFVATPEEFGDDEGRPLAGPMAISAEAWSTGDGVVVKIRATGEIVQQCARCLEEFQAPLTVELEQEYRGEGDADARDDSDESLPLPVGDQIDLTDLARQAFLLTLPMKPLCRPDCRGLCPVCGKNLNEGDCNCVADSVDPRLAKLRDLLGERGVSKDGSAEEEEV